MLQRWTTVEKRTDKKTCKPLVVKRADNTVTKFKFWQQKLTSFMKTIKRTCHNQTSLNKWGTVDQG